MLWDSLSYLFTSPPVAPPRRQVRRTSRCLFTLRGFPAAWVLLSTFMLHASSYQGFPPGYPVAPITQTSAYLIQEGTSTPSRIQISGPDGRTEFRYLMAIQSIEG